MVQWDVPRSSAGALMTVRLAEAHGVPADACLRGTGLTMSDLLDPAETITAAQELGVIGNLLAAVGDASGLGLEAGALFSISTYGIWGFALLTSPNLRSAVETAFQFVDLSLTLTDLSRRVTGDEVQLVITADRVAPEQRRFVVERAAAAIQRMQNDLFTVPIRFNRVAFAFPAPAEDHGRYENVFGFTPEFDAPENVLAFDLKWLDAPLPQASELTTAMALDQCRALLEERRARSGLSGQVRDMLLANLSDPPSSTAVAKALHLGERTLRIRLAGEGTSFRALLDEVREQLAEELLIRGRLPVSEVARRLGYVEISSFSQAFRRWKGMGPRAYRDAALA